MAVDPQVRRAEEWVRQHLVKESSDGGGFASMVRLVLDVVRAKGQEMVRLHHEEDHGDPQEIPECPYCSVFEAHAADVPEPACPECGGTGAVDSGGVTPWMQPIDLPCPSCQRQGIEPEE